MNTIELSGVLVARLSLCGAYLSRKNALQIPIDATLYEGGNSVDDRTSTVENPQD